MAHSKLDEFMRSPRRSLILLSLPVVASSLVETLYTVVDAVFVGRLGADALAALTMAWPLFFVLTAISLGLNAGIASRLSRFLGERNKKQAENTVVHGVLIAAGLSLVILVLALPFLRNILMLSGATGTVLDSSVSYMFVILLGVFFMFVSYAITAIFAAQGDTKTAMKIDIYSLLLNIVLAPIFIFVFHMGVMGSALGTTCAVLFAFVQSGYYLHKKSHLHLRLKSFRYDAAIVREIVGVGLPSTFMLLVAALSSFLLNRVMITFDVGHMAALGIMSRLESISILPVYGLSVGAMTLAGMFYGAKRHDLLRRISWFAVAIGAALSGVIGVVLFAVPEFFLRWFTSDAAVISAGVPYIRVYVLVLPFGSAVMIISRILQGIGKGKPGLVMTIVRSLVLAVPLAYVFVFALGFGYLSIAVASIIGGVVTTALGCLWLFKNEQ